MHEHINTCSYIRYFLREQQRTVHTGSAVLQGLRTQVLPNSWICAAVKGALWGSSLALIALWYLPCYMPSSLRQGGFSKWCTQCRTAMVLYQCNHSAMEGYKHQISTNTEFLQMNEAITDFLLCGSTSLPPNHDAASRWNWSLLTLFIVKPWRFLSAAARHLSMARAWLATGSTAGQEACNYSSLQRCQSVKDGIHAFILANPRPLPLSCLLTFPPPAPLPFFLLSHQPSSLFRWAIKERNKCKWSLVWHKSLLTQSLLKYLPA